MHYPVLKVLTSTFSSKGKEIQYQSYKLEYNDIVLLKHVTSYKIHVYHMTSPLGVK